MCPHHPFAVALLDVHAVTQFGRTSRSSMDPAKIRCLAAMVNFPSWSF
jgi:hypothetical protein